MAVEKKFYSSENRVEIAVVNRASRRIPRGKIIEKGNEKKNCEETTTFDRFENRVEKCPGKMSAFKYVFYMQSLRSFIFDTTLFDFYDLRKLPGLIVRSPKVGSKKNNVLLKPIMFA